MKFSCTQENLHQGLQIVSHGAIKNVNLPILSNVLVRVADKTIRLTTTNLEIAVTATVRGKVDEDGEFTVPSKLFAEYVSLLSNERVDVGFCRKRGNKDENQRHCGYRIPADSKSRTCRRLP
ncbi:hypothetical protein KBD18_01265, partial [Patescibacteria group bacterium]|nr:hypothetical protein [Patescibacteria group bacterium]